MIDHLRAANSRSQSNPLALHVAHGPFGTAVIDATLPGWERPEGHWETWPQHDQDLLTHLQYLMDDAQWWVDSIDDAQLGDGLQVVLVRYWERPDADHEVFMDLDTVVVNVRPTAGCGGWASYALADALANP